MRPYRSPVGVPGAVVTIVVALVTMYYQLQDPVYRGARVLRWRRSTCSASSTSRSYGRNQLILSPEEEFAMSKGEKGSRLSECDAQSRGALRTVSAPRSILRGRLTDAEFAQRGASADVGCLRPEPPDDG